MYAFRTRKPIMLTHFPGRIPFIHHLLGCIQCYLNPFIEPEWVDVKVEREWIHDGCVDNTSDMWGYYDAELDEWTQI
jgi:hypothetical protein